MYNKLYPKSLKDLWF